MNRNEKIRQHLPTNTYSEINYDELNLVEITRELIQQLPEKQKMVIHLRDVEGYSFEEIAAMIELDINAVRMNVSRARKTLRDQLTKISNYGIG